MTVGFRIVRDMTRASKPLIQAFAEIPTPLISDNMNRMFAGGAGVRPIHKQGTMCGPALTVRTRAGDNLMVHKAIDMAEPGDVIVVEAGGAMTNAIIGEIMTRYGASRGVAGFVIDGAVRDAGAIAAGTLPVYARGVTHRGPYKDGPGEINVAIAIDGMVIQPGDIVVGDEDGVVAVPLGEAAKILELARAQVRAEARTMKAIADGTLDRSWVDQRLAERGCKP
jgi:regulator of RNase E activity RraA